MTGAVESAMALHALQAIDRRLDEANRLLAELKALVGDTRAQGEKIMAEIDDLVREVQEANTAMESAAKLIAGLSAQIRGNLHNPSQLAALARDLDARSTALQEAIKASDGGMGDQPVEPTPPAPTDQGAGTLPVGADGQPVQLDSTGAPIGGPRPNDPLTGKPVPGGEPVAPMGTGNASGISTTSPNAPTDAQGNPQPKAPNT